MRRRPHLPAYEARQTSLPTKKSCNNRHVIGAADKRVPLQMRRERGSTPGSRQRERPHQLRARLRSFCPQGPLLHISRLCSDRGALYGAGKRMNLLKGFQRTLRNCTQCLNARLFETRHTLVVIWRRKFWNEHHLRVWPSDDKTEQNVTSTAIIPSLTRVSRKTPPAC